MAEGMTPFKRIVIVAGALIVMQIGFIAYFSHTTGSQDPNEVMRQALKRSSEGTNERAVALAIQLFKTENKGKLPQTLEELIPKYLPSRPMDTKSGKPIAYKIEGASYVLGVLGEDGKMIATKAGGGKNTEENLAKTFLAALADSPNAKLVHYDPRGKRDPFRPFDLSGGKDDFDSARTPLQTANLSELSLSAVVEQGEEAAAIIETPDGKGHTVKKGDKIGTNEGEVVEILGDRIVVVEQIKDFTGEDKSHTTELYMKGNTSPSASKKKGGRI